MISFRYTLIDGDGQRRVGRIDAESLADAVRRLESGGGRVEQIEPIEAGVGEEGVESGGGESESREETNSGTREEKERKSAGGEGVVEAVSQLTGSGLPLVPGLRALAEEARSRRQQRALLAVADSLEQGESLGTAMRQCRASAELTALLAAAEISEQPIELMEAYLSRIRMLATLSRRSALALFYPVLLLVISAVLVVVLFLSITPALTDIYEDFSMQLPWVTEFILHSISKPILANWHWMAPGTLLVLVGCGLAMQRWVQPATRRRWVWALPVVGPMVQAMGVSRFSHMLAVLLKHKIPLTQGLTLAGTAAGDAAIEVESQRLAAELDAEGMLQLSADGIPGFPISLARMAADEPGGHFADALHDVGDLFANQARTQSHLVIATLQPFLLVSLGAFLVLSVIALVAPLYELLGNLS